MRKQDSKDKKFAEQVKHFRLTRQWTQKQFAAFLRISLRTVRTVEARGRCGDLTRAKIKAVTGIVEEAAA